MMMMKMMKMIKMMKMRKMMTMMMKRESRQSPHIGCSPTHSYKATACTLDLEESTVEYNSSKVACCKTTVDTI